MSKLINRVGERYGRLTVVSRSQDKVHPCGKSSVVWRCKCDCGNYVDVTANNLRMGHTKSCGCITMENPPRITHNGTNECRRLWNIWKGMKQRCLNPNVPCHKNYGGRGIEMCKEWMEFEPFRDWALENGYSDELSLDRIDNNGNYEPSNCRWTTMLIQRHNQRRLCDWQDYI